MKMIKESLKDKVYKLIKERILSCEYRLGENIVISHLSKELEISNSPIREALSHLSSEGLVNIVGNSKYEVVCLTEKKLRDLNKIVFLQLSGALEICIEENRIEKLVSLLSESYAEHEKMFLSNKEFDYKYIMTSLNFDRQFVVATENSYLIDIFDFLLPQLILASVYNKKTYKEIHLEAHIKLLKFIESREFEKAFDELAVHFNKDYTSMEFNC